MSTSAAWFRSAVVSAGVVALVVLAVQHEREQRALVSKLGGDIQSLRATVVDTRAVAPAPVTVVAPAALDSEALEVVATHAAHAAAAERATEAKIAEEANAPTPEQLVARDAARRTLDGAIASGRLRPDDVEAIRRALPDDDREGRLEMRRQIAVAINLGKLVPEDPRVMFP